MTAAAGGRGTRPGATSGPEPDAERRRRRLGEDERRQQIIRGCVEVLACEGYGNASLARIAQAAGVSKGLVSHYFSDKETLMEQTAIVTVAYLRAEVAAAIDLTADVPTVLKAAVHYASRMRQTHSRELRAVGEIAHNLRHPDGSPRLDLRAYEDTYRAQEQLFQSGQREGSLRDFDTRVMAVTYQGAVDTMIAYLEAHPDADPHAYADALLDILLAAIRR
jgi:AcrR family transcriptional regulator